MSSAEAVLARYSKPRGVGDQTSGGLGKLLQSDLSRTELLVRETIQNSWDAKLEGWTPAYGIAVRRAGPDLGDILKNSVFSDRTELKTLESSLETSDLHVTEVYDRGTRGLDGPVVPGRAVSPGEPNNFNALVFDIGTTKSESGSGGTYGFGKTAAFEASSCHAVVYWTCTLDSDNNPDYRLIASCLSQPYAEGDTSYTGAHWWGVRDSEAPVGPLRGDAAKALGERLFTVHFGEADDGTHETGMSMLIVDPVAELCVGDSGPAVVRPVRTDEDASNYATRIASDIAKNLWPKMLEEIGADQPPMFVAVRCGDDFLDVAGTFQEQFKGYAYSLQVIREEQRHANSESMCNAIQPPPTCIAHTIDAITLSASAGERNGFTRRQLFGHPKTTTVGHLHLWAQLSSPQSADSAVIDANRVCLMRSEAELVVNYICDEASDMGDVLRWYGVFKPTPECDEHFARCEPPSHDAWSPLTTAPPESRYVVEKTLAHVRRKTRQFLTERQSPPSEEKTSVRRIAESLRSLVPLAPLETNKDSATQKSRQAAMPRRKASRRVTVTSMGTPDHRRDKTVAQTISFRVDGSSDRFVQIVPSVRAVTLEGELQLSTAEVRLDFPGGRDVFGPTETGELTVITSGDARLEIELEEKSV